MKSVDTLRQQVIQNQMNKPGLRGRINAMCCACLFDPTQPGNWRNQVGRCTATHCPLWDVRPISTVQTAAETDKLATIEG